LSVPLVFLSTWTSRVEQRAGPSGGRPSLAGRRSYHQVDK
jgi:hypothetical protein